LERRDFASQGGRGRKCAAAEFGTVLGTGIRAREQSADRRYDGPWKICAHASDLQRAGESRPAKRAGPTSDGLTQRFGLAAWQRPTPHEKNDRENHSQLDETLQERLENEHVVTPLPGEESRKDAHARRGRATESGGDEEPQSRGHLEQRPAKSDGTPPAL